ncbi:MAG TPA: tRNA pseudouridine(55) synthase TruB, partial [Roseiarcus sp.]|nr:tRNA pseudouridine(55) synthase TruB [Roseiarcus sp.]
ERLLPRFVGVILQTPPTFSAIRIAGARAYDLARGGETFEIEPRPIHVYRLELISAEADEAVLEAECGKGAYVRAIARDLGRALGCHGHVVELRRTRVGPFSADSAVPLDRLPDDPDLMARALLPLQAALSEMPVLRIERAGAAILRRGQKLLLRGAAPTEGRVYAECSGTPIAFGVVEDGYFVSTRVFNLRG